MNLFFLLKKIERKKKEKEKKQKTERKNLDVGPSPRYLCLIIGPSSW